MDETNIQVNLDSTDEIEKMGKLLGEINVENDKGVDVSIVYYESGIEEFDKFLKHEPFYEYGLTFHICSYENAFAFVLYHPEKKIYAHRIAFWRNSLRENEHGIATDMMKPFVKNNLFLNAAKSGAFISDGGLITAIAGGLISRATGSVISKLRGVKTVELTAVGYKIIIENSEPICLYCKEENNLRVSNFIITHLVKSLDQNRINNSDSRCYIATACYSKLDSVEIITFRNWRDNKLARYRLGKLAIRLYYYASPTLISVCNTKTKKIILRIILNPLFNLLYPKYYGKKTKS